MDNQSERIALLDRLRQGDDQALEPLIELTRKRAYRLAYSILNDCHGCQDVLQDCYWVVFQKIGQLRDPKLFWGWFSQIIIHRARANLRHRWQFLDDLPEPEPMSPSPALETRIDLQEALLASTRRTAACSPCEKSGNCPIRKSPRP